MTFNMFHYFTLILAGVPLSLALLNCNEPVQKLSLCSVDPAYDPGISNGWPLNITPSSVTLFSVSEFSDTLRTITLNLLIAVIWKDSRLSIKSSNPEEEPTWYNLNDQDSKEIFFPTLKINRAKEVIREIKYGPVDKDYFWFNQKKGFFEYQQALKVTIYCSLDFGRYPFDSHHCNFSYGDASYGIEKVRILPPKIRIKEKSHLFRDEPIFMQQSRLPFRITLESLPDFVHFEAGFNYSYTGIAIHMKRNSLGLLTGSFYGPTMIFTTLSLISFSISPEVVPGRLGLLITLYLIASNVYNSVKGPPKRGFSYIEIWMLGVHIPMLTAIFEYGFLLAMKKYYANTKEDMEGYCKKVDFFTFCASALFIIIFNLIYWTYTAFLD